MKEIFVALIKESFKYAKEKGLGELCMLLALFACFLSMVAAAGWHPLNFGLLSKPHAINSALAEEKHDE